MTVIYTFDSYVQMPVLKLPARCTLVKLKKRLVMISPIHFTEAQIDEIKKIGDVTDIVAPCLFHHLFVNKASHAFPEAKIWGVTGFDKKRPDIKWNQVLTEDTWDLQDELGLIALKGSPKINESVFYHKESRTLIVTDLCFNLDQGEKMLERVVFGLLGTYKKFAVSRLVKLAVRDKDQFVMSLKEMMRWNFEKIIMAHGKIIEENGQNLLRDALVARGFSI